jgi:ABC-type branched-subunit amino acid transport system substrate-binding protein
MDLEGDSQGLGQGMRVGIEAALNGEQVKGRKLELIAVNDFYNPDTTIEATQQLLDQGIFVMLGNVGTPTAKVSLPLLAKHNVPAVGFFTGAGLLRPGVGDVINFRASYVQETAAVIDAALTSGIKPGEVCAFVQNDAYGMAGVAGIKAALAGHADAGPILEKLDDILDLPGAEPRRNGIGPVGVYRRNTLYVRDGYDSLKAWENLNGLGCRLVVGVGTYTALANFSAYALQKGEQWLMSAVSFTGAENFTTALANYDISSGIIMTQVVPPLSAKLPIVAEARTALGEDFGYVSLEGYIVGKLFVAALENIKGEITRENFLNALRGKRFDLGGLAIDFSDDNQGSDYVSMTYLNDGGFEPITIAEFTNVLQ